jgi:hypothetical protein
MLDMTGLWPRSPWSMLAFLLIAITLLYLGRSAAHNALRALGEMLQQAFKAGSRSVMSAHDRLVQRNREVLLEMGRESTERLIEREFQRVNAVVVRDLSSYPALHRKLADQITRIDEDYREATEVPPSPPDWTRVVESIATIPPQGDPLVARILGDISGTLGKAHKGAMSEYRKASGERHRLLRKMLPFWRKLDHTLDRVHTTIASLQERSLTIDRQMGQYEQIRENSDDAVRMLSASSMTHFVSSSIVLLIALMGGFINFHLIALPMSEMVGATSYVGPVKTSDIAALVIITTEIAMGLFLMESLRITKLFPVIGRMDDQLRQRMLWVSFGILFTLACVESSLAYMRDLLAVDREALTLSLAGLEAAPVRFRWIPSIGQMVMGFMLPFALAFAAIPLESFIHSSRVVSGSGLALCLRTLAGTFELLESMASHLATMLVHLYDLLIMIPLKIEHLLTRPRAPKPVKSTPIELPRTM